MPEVIVVGAGPVGSLLAALLTAEGVDVDVFEKRAEIGGGTRAIGLHAPVLAALETNGITDELLASAIRVGRGEARSNGRLLGAVRFDHLAVRHPYVATLPQSATEAVLTARVPRVTRSARVLSVRQSAGGARVQVDQGGIEHDVDATVVVLAAGWSGREMLYRQLPTRIYRDRYLMADVDVGERLDADVAVVHLDRDGVLESFPLPGHRRRVVAWDRPPADDTSDAQVVRLAEAVDRRGDPTAAAAVTEASAFGVRRVVAPALRRGSVVAIGDSAHEVSPIGGQGMNLGLLDAVTLAPLLVAWVRSGTAPDAALVRWERRRVRSATTAARLAAVNTVLGRPRGPLTDAARRAALRLALAPPAGALFASAYAMGLDADA